MKKHTAESLKAGLQAEATPAHNEQKKHQSGTGFEDATRETDADELVHGLKEQPAAAADEEQDLDELVHRSPVKSAANNEEESDPDDLVHENEAYSDE
ncbi:MAG: hypothetical protein JNM14_02460 [Ferruginibacter sp.]|nr:hypothetical protein [Ferruginibacter sp.]